MQVHDVHINSRRKYDDFISKEEAREFLGYTSMGTVNSYVKKGRIRGYIWRKKLYFRLSELDRFKHSILTKGPGPKKRMDHPNLKRKHVTIRLRKSLSKQLDSYSDRINVSKSDIIERALMNYMRDYPAE